jgi:hypothetical protein
MTQVENKVKYAVALAKMKIDACVREDWFDADGEVAVYVLGGGGG